MSKYIANYVGFSSNLEAGNGNKGIWILVDQFFFKGKEGWNTTRFLGSANGRTIIE